MTFEDTRAEGGGCGGGTTARKHAAHANDGGGLLGIRSLVRRRPPSVPRGGGGNAAGNSAAPARPGGSSAVPVPRQRSRLQQQERYSQQKEQQHHQQPRGPSTNTSARAGPSKRRITGYGGPGDHEQRRAPSSSHQSHEHLRRAPRPRTRPLSQPRGMLTTSGTLATGGMSAGQQQRSAQRPRHGTPTSRSDAARSGRSLAVGTGAGVGVGVGGDARRPMRFQLHGQSSLDTCLTQEKLGDTLVKLDKIEEAHWQYLMAFRGLQQCNLPKDNPHTARILVSLGDVFFSAADYSRALKYYEKSIRFHAETNSDDVCGGLMKCALANESMAKNDWVKGEVDMCRFHVRELLWLLTYESPAARALFETKGAVKRQRVIANGFVSIPALRSSRCLRQVRATKTRRSHISKSRRLCSFARDPLRPTWTFSVF